MLKLITELKPGMTLSDAVLTPGGKVLLAPNFVLTANAIALLSSWEVETVYIHSRETEQQTLPSENIPENYYVVSPDAVEFQNKYSSVIHAVTTLYDFIRKEMKVPILALKEAATDISHTITENHSSLHYLLLNNQNSEDPAAHHGVTVAFIAGLIGKRIR
jgi:hypothetical protein